MAEPMEPAGPVVICGVKSCLGDPTWRKAVDAVLRGIAGSAPEDLRELVRKVLFFEPLPPEYEEGVVGRWHVTEGMEEPDLQGQEFMQACRRGDQERMDEIRKAHPPGGKRARQRGTIQLREGEKLDAPSAVAVVAHELGHAIAQDADASGDLGLFCRRDRTPEVKQKCEELAADRYAAKWGFREQLLQDWAHRVRHNSFPPPGMTFEEPLQSGEVMVLRVTSEFTLELLGYGKQQR